MRPIEVLLARLDDPRPNGKDRWRCRCPACGGNKSALSVGIGDDEAVLLRCWKGCDVQQVVSALGLSLTDLFTRTDRMRSPPLARRRLLSANQCVEVIAFECLLTWTAAWNLANGHALTTEDLARLSTAAARIQEMVREVGS